MPALAAGHALLAGKIRGALYDLDKHETEDDEGLRDRLVKGVTRLSQRLPEWQT